MSTAARLITAEEFAELADLEDGAKLELVRGQIVELSPPKGPHGFSCAMLSYLLIAHVRPRRLGFVLSNDAGVVLERGPDTVLCPDVGYWSKERCPKLPEGFLETPPDLAVEVVSPSDRLKHVRAKAEQYLNWGVRLVWLVNPRRQTVTVCRKLEPRTELTASDTLTGSEVLPEFCCQVAEIFE